MSWRKFSCLFRGLSQNSVWVAICSGEEALIEDPEEVERAVNSVWG
jgi:hypothetical protein